MWGVVTDFLEHIVVFFSEFIWKIFSSSYYKLTLTHNLVAVSFICKPVNIGPFLWLLSMISLPAELFAKTFNICLFKYKKYYLQKLSQHYTLIFLFHTDSLLMFNICSILSSSPQFYFIHPNWKRMTCLFTHIVIDFQIKQNTNNDTNIFKMCRFH
jgi:hypothetical protein